MWAGVAWAVCGLHATANTLRFDLQFAQQPRALAISKSPLFLRHGILPPQPTSNTHANHTTTNCSEKAVGIVVAHMGGVSYVQAFIRGGIPPSVLKAQPAGNSAAIARLFCNVQLWRLMQWPVGKTLAAVLLLGKPIAQIYRECLAVLRRLQGFLLAPVRAPWARRIVGRRRALRTWHLLAGLCAVVVLRPQHTHAFPHHPILTKSQWAQQQQQCVRVPSMHSTNSQTRVPG